VASKAVLTDKTIDGLNKSLLVLSRAVDEILEKRAVRTAIKKHLSGSKVQVLRLLAQRGKRTSTQVARFLGVSKPAVSQIIDSLVHSKLVTRRSAKDDRREVELGLTAAGRTQYNAIRRTQRHLLRNTVRHSEIRNVTRLAETLVTVALGLVESDKVFEDYCLQCGAHEDASCVLVDGGADCLFLEATAGPIKRKMKTKKTTKKKAAKRS